MKNIFVFMLAVLLSVSIVAAMTPMPVSVTLKNEGVLSGYDIQIMNKRRGNGKIF